MTEMKQVTATLQGWVNAVLLLEKMAPWYFAGKLDDGEVTFDSVPKGQTRSHAGDDADYRWE